MQPDATQNHIWGTQNLVFLSFSTLHCEFLPSIVFLRLLMNFFEAKEDDDEEQQQQQQQESQNKTEIENVLNNLSNYVRFRLSVVALSFVSKVFRDFVVFFLFTRFLSLSLAHQHRSFT